MKLNEIIEMDSKYYMKTFGNRTPVCFGHGKGMYLWDTEGKKYTDMLGGLAVNALGHSHPKLVDAITSQACKLIHCSNLYYIETQARLAKVLVENSCADRVFFANSGAEANEAAIKLARIYFKKNGQPEKYEIITLINSFHGRTLTTVAATGQEKYQKPFAPLTPGFRHVPINNIDELEKAIGENTCAIMMEPIQGESGVNPVTKEYAQAVRKLCDEKGLLLIFDEIQCGLGRTGELFAYLHLGVEPDIFTLAKALGGGFPIGAVLAKEPVASAFEKGDHGSTFGGNPLACAAGLAVMDVLLNDGLIENARKMGAYLKHKLEDLKAKFPSITEIRGKGLMIGIQLNNSKAASIASGLLGKGYLVGSVGADIIRLLPPLVIEKHDIDGFVEALENVLQELQE